MEEEQEEGTQYNKRPRKQKNKKKIIIPIVIIAVILIVLIGIAVYLLVRPKFQDITIELGTTEISAKDFLVSDMYENGAEIVTSLEEIDLNSVQEYEIVLSYKGKNETVKLNIVDTTAPTVVFRDASGDLEYVPDPNDFIESKEDYSEMTVEFIDEVTFEDYGKYEVNIKVIDSYGNETDGTATLVITWIITEVDIELGSEFTKANLVLDVERFGQYIDDSEIAEVNTMAVGTYELNIEYEGKTYTCTVNVQDTVGPDLQLKNISIWSGETVSSYESFITSASDVSGEVTTECLTQINYSTIGEQAITIRATDVNGNVTEKTATLTIKTDTTGPVFSGLTDLTVNKNTSIDYNSGVTAKDEKDGTCTFTVDSSGVNVSTAGTYYATYTSSDLSGNTTTAKRKVTVSSDQTDTNAKLTEFYNNYCAGKDAVAITKVVRDRITYNSNWGGNDPVWYGLTNGKGNCYVHAVILQKLLQKAGYSCQIIYTTDKSHYWNLVYYSGGWYHFDSTKSNYVHYTGPATDDQKHGEASFGSKRTWDASLWPASATTILSTETN